MIKLHLGVDTYTQHKTKFVYCLTCLSWRQDAYCLSTQNKSLPNDDSLATVTHIGSELL